ncbi:MAG: hypothetical protein HC828_21835 [Blastochloris sp.]|nr:hypothetical protein [Blastochloris sp.]
MRGFQAVGFFKLLALACALRQFNSLKRQCCLVHTRIEQVEFRQHERVIKHYAYRAINMFIGLQQQVMAGIIALLLCIGRIVGQYKRTLHPKVGV